jgi:hypothetical protein
MVSFTAVIESTWSTVGGHCVIEKKIRAYERNGDGIPTQITVEPPGGPGADDEDLATDPDTPNALVWYTDPYLVVSDHGTLYLRGCVAEIRRRRAPIRVAAMTA